ncbi:factor-independent urate hydroxylase [Chitinophaga sp. CF418]|uniref:factor-independent urate hydroxylase n=1 Tax=Chitinophaga sp. CF418 TaxID=1855287 RepID=UPI000910B77C|nr:urate oxidase [Chitinophaga sp. CF418]SHL99955.1 urate oxidase [Chitinophaga sp. CF418]
MKIKLGENSYGKNAVQLSKIIRHPAYHEFRQVTVNVSLKGDFDEAHTTGDNSKILPTDTQKNTVYALAKDHFKTSIEDFALYLANYFVTTQPQVETATIEITEHLYHRMQFDGVEHPHAYIGGGSEKKTAQVIKNASDVSVQSGITDLLILKTTDSGFEKYIKDKYTTLKETADRIFATKCDINWTYDKLPADYTAQFNSIRELLLQTFAGHKSLSVQQTLYAMGQAVLEAYDGIREIHLQMPNKHHIPFNLEQFDIQNQNEIFIATDEPYGLIVATVTRE